MYTRWYPDYYLTHMSFLNEHSTWVWIKTILFKNPPITLQACLIYIVAFYLVYKGTVTSTIHCRSSSKVLGTPTSVHNYPWNRITLKIIYHWQKRTDRQLWWISAIKVNMKQSQWKRNVSGRKKFSNFWIFAEIQPCHAIVLKVTHSQDQTIPRNLFDERRS